MLSAIPHTESTPPLYYVLAWLVGARCSAPAPRGFARSPRSLERRRSCSLALIARRLAGEPRARSRRRRWPATSPLLIWYSQEARAYGLLVLLGAVSLGCLLREHWRGWALTAVLALATHYFSLFIIVPEAVWVPCTARAARATPVPARPRRASWAPALLAAGDRPGIPEAPRGCSSQTSPRWARGWPRCPSSS